MSYRFDPHQPYRMPTHFGPATGPRRGPEGRRFACADGPRTEAISASFLTRIEALDRLLPPGFRAVAEPVVTVTASFMADVEWLAGRGYNTLGVSFPAEFAGKEGPTVGRFLAVLWENLADPIITGREELGYAKLYAEIPAADWGEHSVHCHAEWLGFRFLELSASDLRSGPAPRQPAEPPSSGMLHYKYVPRTGCPGAADAAYAVLTPVAVPNKRVTEEWHGCGHVAFHAARWEDMPTQYAVVNGLRALEMLEPRGASVVRSVGGKDLSDQRILPAADACP